MLIKDYYALVDKCVREVESSICCDCPLRKYITLTGHADNCPVRKEAMIMVKAEENQMGKSREFTTGATRDVEDGKFDYEGFFDPLVLECYAAYMDKNRIQSDGTLRNSDNWQRGLPQDVCIKSGLRHVVTWWKLHRGHICIDERDGHIIDKKEAICGLLFNGMCYLSNLLKEDD